MAESVYKIIELVGTSTESWEKAAVAAVEEPQDPDDLRIAEIASRPADRRRQGARLPRQGERLLQVSRRD
jgi:hypothetical protein